MKHIKDIAKLMLIDSKEGFLVPNYSTKDWNHLSLKAAGRSYYASRDSDFPYRPFRLSAIAKVQKYILTRGRFRPKEVAIDRGAGFKVASRTFYDLVDFGTEKFQTVEKELIRAAFVKDEFGYYRTQKECTDLIGCSERTFYISRRKPNSDFKDMELCYLLVMSYLINKHPKIEECKTLSESLIWEKAPKAIKELYAKK